MDTRTELLDQIAAFCRVTGMSEATLSHKAMSSGVFVSRLRAGASCTIESYDRVRRYIVDNWPADADEPCPVLLPATAAEGGEAAVS